MSQNYPSLTAAVGSVQTNGTALWGAGAASARTSAGVYTLTLDQGCDANQCAVMLTRRGAAAAADGEFGVVHTSDTVKEVTYTLAGVATDVAFDYHILKAPLS